MIVVETDELTRWYVSGPPWAQRVTVALHPLSLKVEAGESMLVVGPSGAGKSTLLAILLGLRRPTSGAARLFGLPASQPAARARVGSLLQRPRLPTMESPVELVAGLLATRGRSRAEAWRQAGASLEAFGAPTGSDARCGELSPGMAQRVGLAAAIAPSPDLLILDEPLSDLDPAGAQVVMERLIEQTRRGTTLIVASHRVQATAPLADQMAWLSKGRLVRLGAADEILGALPVRVTYTLPATSAEVTEGEALPARHPLRIRRVTALRKARLLQQIKEGGGRLLGVDPELVQPPNPADNEATLA